jgi:hypothetical protein
MKAIPTKVANETSLGITLMIVVTIAGNEIAHLVPPILAIIVMGCACWAGVLAYERGA